MANPLPKLSDYTSGKVTARELLGTPSFSGVLGGKPEGVVTFIVYGAPRTKKNHNRLVPGRGDKKGRQLLLPSAPWEKWVKTALLRPITARLRDQPYSCRALFYRDRLGGDTCGFYQGLADALEEWGILSDDKLIADWDGTRLLKDAERPRVEVTLTPVSA